MCVLCVFSLQPNIGLFLQASNLIFIDHNATQRVFFTGVEVRQGLPLQSFFPSHDNCIAISMV